MPTQTNKIYQCLHGECLPNEWGRGAFILGHTRAQVSHFADDPPGSAHRHHIKENKSKEKEFGRQSGRVVTILTPHTHTYALSTYTDATLFIIYPDYLATFTSTYIYLLPQLPRTPAH